MFLWCSHIASINYPPCSSLSQPLSVCCIHLLTSLFATCCLHQWYPIFIQFLPLSLIISIRSNPSCSLSDTLFMVSLSSYLLVYVVLSSLLHLSSLLCIIPSYVSFYVSFLNITVNMHRYTFYLQYFINWIVSYLCSHCFIIIITSPTTQTFVVCLVFKSSSNYPSKTQKHTRILSVFLIFFKYLYSSKINVFFIS